MASISGTNETLQLETGGVGDSNKLALTALTTLFFLWGFITCLNDILIPHLKNVFSLNYTQAMLIQFCFFSAYFIASLPSASLVKRIGFKMGMVTGLTVAAIGCLMFYPAASMQSYPLFLAALFVLASGITCLQVSANPYVAALGPAQTASSRLTMTQAFNSLGTTVAPFFGGLLILSGVALGTEQLALMTDSEIEAYKLAKAEAVQMPYVGLGAALFVMATFFAWIKLPAINNIEQSEAAEKSSLLSVLKFPQLRFGAIGIFLYVGAEVAIGSFIVNFLAEAHIANMEESEAAHYIAFYWGGAMVGRFIGAVVMQYYAANKVLLVNSLATVGLLLLAVFGEGQLAMWSLLAIGLCNSIMFPTIFTLALDELKEQTSSGSGVLCLAIVGGAIVPLLQGMLADSIGVQLAFLLPVLCYLYIAFYGLKGSQLRLN